MFPSERLDQDQIRPSFNFSNSEGEKTNKVENQPGLLTEGMKGNRGDRGTAEVGDVTEGAMDQKSGGNVGSSCKEAAA